MWRYYLLHLEYFVDAYQVAPVGECSELTQKNAERFLNDGGHIHEIKTEMDLDFPDQGLIIDGLFNGIKGDVQDPYAYVIKAANQSGLTIIAIDIPSGLNGETGIASSSTINATETAYLGLPKSGFFLNDPWGPVWAIYAMWTFGLPQEYVEELEADLLLVTPDMIVPHMPKMKRSRNKYDAGVTYGLAGSPAVCRERLCYHRLPVLRGGAGLVKLLHPKGMELELGAVPVN